MANNYVGDFLGSAVTVYAANYADIKMLPITNQIKNSSIVKVLAVAASIFYTSGQGNFYGQALRGSGTWAVGSLLEPYITKHIQQVELSNTAVTITPQSQTTTPNTTAISVTPS